MYRGGLAYMRYSISDTAEYGDYTAGPRLVTDATRAEMKKFLAEIQDGTFATNWIRENETGRKAFDKMRSKEAEHPMEEVGSKLRAAMPFLDPVTVTVDSPGAAPRLAEPVGA
jgi:ketol-acid reductoisomerase